MNAYMVYNRSASSIEGALLVFAKNGKDARKLAYRQSQDFLPEWTDIATKRIRRLPVSLRTLDDGTEKVFDNLPVCECCWCWGGEPVSGGYCSICKD